MPPSKGPSLDPALETVQPVAVARNYDRIHRIPRPSGYELPVCKDIEEWSASHGFRSKRSPVSVEVDDGQGGTKTVQSANIAVYVPGSQGCEDLRPVLVQTHMDIVCAKAEESTHDFHQDPIQLERTGDRLHTKNHQTTQGADNGMGMAMAMAAAEDPNIKRPPMVLLFTADEERGMGGAEQLAEGLVPTNIMGIINLDSEEGPAYVCNGSAGGNDINGKWDISEVKQEVPEGYKSLEIKLSGLMGGHSGVDVHTQPGNAIKLLNEALLSLRENGVDFLLESFNNKGGIRNTLPKSAECVIHFPLDSSLKVKGLLRQAQGRMKQQLGEKGNDLKIESREVDPKYALTEEVRNNIMDALQEIPTEVVKWQNDEVGDPVTVSNNIGVIKTDEDSIQVHCLARAAVHETEALSALNNRIIGILEKYQANAKQTNSYKGWQEKEGSVLVSLAQKAAEKVCGQGEVTTFAYHAGLELKAIRDKLVEFGASEDISCVSIGPNINYAHTLNEEIEIPTILTSYQVFASILGGSVDHQLAQAA